MKGKKILIAAIVLVGGYLLGALIKIPDFSSSKLEGNISKVNRYKKSVVSEQSQLIIGKLLNDGTFRNQTLTSLTVFAAGAGEFNAVAAISAEASEGISQMKESHEAMKNLVRTSSNASLNTSAAVVAVQAALKGENSEVEQSLSNALLSYVLLSRNISTVKNWIADAKAFLSGKNVSDYQQLAFACDRWAAYGAFDAMLNGDSEQAEYWSKLETLLSPAETMQMSSSLEGRSLPLAVSDHIKSEFLKMLFVRNSPDQTEAGLALPDDVLELSSWASGLILRSSSKADAEVLQNTGFSSQKMFEAVLSPEGLAKSALLNAKTSAEQMIGNLPSQEISSALSAMSILRDSYTDSEAASEAVPEMETGNFFMNLLEAKTRSLGMGIQVDQVQHNLSDRLSKEELTALKNGLEKDENALRSNGIQGKASFHNSETLNYSQLVRIAVAAVDAMVTSSLQVKVAAADAESLGVQSITPEMLLAVTSSAARQMELISSSNAVAILNSSKEMSESMGIQLMEKPGSILGVVETTGLFYGANISDIVVVLNSLGNVAKPEVLERKAGFNPIVLENAVTFSNQLQEQVSRSLGAVSTLSYR